MNIAEEDKDITTLWVFGATYGVVASVLILISIRAAYKIWILATNDIVNIYKVLQYITLIIYAVFVIINNGLQFEHSAEMYYQALINYIISAYYMSDLLTLNCWHNFYRHMKTHTLTRRDSLSVQKRITRLRAFEKTVFLVVCCVAGVYIMV